MQEHLAPEHRLDVVEQDHLHVAPGRQGKRRHEIQMPAADWAREIGLEAGARFK